MFIPKFQLPSDPSVEIEFAEATVATMMDIAGIDPQFEEALTTRFLDAVKKSGPSAAGWTGDDRRMALLWYYVATNDDHVYQAEYQCSCGQAHRFEFDLKSLLDGYRAIDGPAHREIELDGQPVVVRPLSGAQLETLEIDFAAAGDKPEENVKAKLRMLTMMCDFNGRWADIGDMPVRLLVGLRDKTAAALAEMAHGLESVYDDGRYYLISPAHRCPDGKKEVDTRVRVPFRAYDYIPIL